MSLSVSDFAPIIAEQSITIEEGPGQKRVERGEVIFIDGSRLATYESRKGTRFKYGYQWMTTTDETIYRWDNTPHFPPSIRFRITATREPMKLPNHMRLSISPMC